MRRKDIGILRKRQSESEDRLDRSWMPQKGQRVLGGGNIRYEISDRVRAVDCGGLGVIQLLVEQLQLAQTAAGEKGTEFFSSRVFLDSTIPGVFMTSRMKRLIPS